MSEANPQPYTRRDASPLKPFVPFYPRPRPEPPVGAKAAVFLFIVFLIVVCGLCGSSPNWQ